MGGTHKDTAHLPDVVYVVRPGDDNEELRYSLRSVAANVPHRKVWIAGHCPWWVKNVEAIELPPLEDRFDNQHQSLSAAINHPGMADEFYYFNDDIYVAEQFDGILPTYHLGPLAEFVAWLDEVGKSPKNEWLQGCREMLDLLTSWGLEPLSYEGHAPLRFRREDMARFLPLRTRHFLPAQFYAAADLPPGELGIDAKGGLAGCPIEAKFPYLSTDDESFERSRIGEYVRDMFPAPGFYEGAPRASGGGRP